MNSELRHDLVYTVNNAAVVQALDKGWEPDIEAMMEDWFENLQTWSKTKLVEELKEFISYRYQTGTQKVIFLSEELAIEATKFLEDLEEKEEQE